MFTILATLVAVSRPLTFHSTALIEIGQYNLNNDLLSKNVDSTIVEKIVLIQTQKDAINELKIAFIHKQKDDYSNIVASFSPKEKRLIAIQTQSSSIEEGENLFSTVFSYLTVSY